MNRSNFYWVFVFVIPIFFLNCQNNPTIWVLDGGFIEKVAPKLKAITPKSETQLLLVFDEPLEPTSAENVAQYAITPSLLVVSASVNQPGDEVTLTTATQIPQKAYSLTVSGVTDLVNNAIQAPDNQGTFIGFGVPPVPVFKVYTDSAITSGVAFNVTLVALDIVGNAIMTSHQGAVTWEVTSGSGSITVDSAPGWTNGEQIFTVTYTNAGLTYGQNEAIIITAKDNANPSFTGSSNGIFVGAVPHLDHLRITKPGSATLNVSFSVTIDAYGQDNQLFSGYNGTVNISANGGVGDLTPSTLTLVNGTITDNLIFNGLSQELKLIATDAIDTTITGISASFPVLLSIENASPLNVAATPFATSVFLTWTLVNNADSYKVYRDGTIITTLGSGIDKYYNTLLTVATSYQYKVEAYDSVGALITTSEITVITAVCKTTIAGATINVPQNWDAANSPYCVSANVDIASGGILTLLPGTVVKFAANTGINVQPGGELQLAGTQGQQVLLTTDQEPPTIPPPVGGFWNGIDFLSGAIGTSFDGLLDYSDGSRIQYATIEFAGPAIRNKGDLLIEYSTFRYNFNAVDGGALEFQSLAANKVIVRYSIFYSNRVSGAGDHGGAAAFYGSSTLLYFDYNLVLYNYASGGYAGGLVSSVSGTKIRNSVFRGNEKTDTGNGGGGAIWFFGGDNIEVRDNLFINNKSLGSIGGGAIFARNDSNNNIYRKNIFRGNETTQAGGGALKIASDTFTIEDNTFESNQAIGGGGAIFLTSVGTTAKTIKNNIFTGNAATTGNGGAIRSIKPNVTYLNNTFTSNVTSGSGGAIHSVIEGTNLDRNHFSLNQASTAGGAVYFTGTTLGTFAVMNNNFDSNSVSASPSNLYLQEPPSP